MAATAVAAIFFTLKQAGTKRGSRGLQLPCGARGVPAFLLLPPPKAAKNDFATALGLSLVQLYKEEIPDIDSKYRAQQVPGVK